MKYIYIILAILIFNNCNSHKNSKIIDKFPEEDTLKGQTIGVSANLLMPSKIFNIENKLVIVDNVNEKIFKIFELPHLKYLYSWGDIGRGYGEFIKVIDNSINVYKNNLEVLNFQQFLTFQVTNDSMLIRSKSRIPFTLEQINRVRKINDSIYLTESPINGEDNNEYYLINNKNRKIICRFGRYPDNGIRFHSNIEKFGAYVKESTIMPEGNKFAAFYTRFNIFRIYNTNGNFLNEIILKTNNANNYNTKNIKNNRIYFYSPVGIKNYLFVLYQDRTQTEIENNLLNTFPKLQIWDWDGNPIVQYTLDKAITAFCISEEHKMLYGICVAEMNKIYSFKLPEKLFETKSNGDSLINYKTKLFQFKTFKNWKNINLEPNGGGDEQNLYTRKDGLKNYVYVFSNGLSGENEATIQINIIYDPESSHLSAKGFYKKYVERNQIKSKEFKFIIYTINSKEIIQTKSIIEASDPKGRNYYIHCGWWAFDFEGKVVEVRYASENKFDEYYDSVLKIISSIKGK